MSGKAVRDHQEESADKSQQPVDFHEAAIVTESGEEIAITEEMVRKAIQQLDQDAYPEADE